MKKNLRRWLVACIGAAALVPAVEAGGPPFTFSTSDGDTTLKLGFLLQPQYEALENSTATDTRHNVFFRRLRLMAGGKLAPKLSYFIESDSANLGKENPGGDREADIFLQDAYLSYAFRPEFQVDGGMIIVPVSHNTTQSAASLMTIDFGPYAFSSSAPTRSKVGRDYGMQARGYIRNRLEYRVGVFRGNRNHDGDFPYRFTARVVYYPLEADTGYFYTGTSLGARKVVAIGGSIDRQGSYSANAVDFYLDHPLPGGDAVTAQANFIRYDGGGEYPFQSLAPQNTWLVEGAYYLHRARLGPYIQFASRDLTEPGARDDGKVQGGVSWWVQKHRVNLKAGYGRLFSDDAADRSQFLVQAQFFYF